MKEHNKSGLNVEDILSFILFLIALAALAYVFYKCSCTMLRQISELTHPETVYLPNIQ